MAYTLPYFGLAHPDRSLLTEQITLVPGIQTKSGQLSSNIFARRKAMPGRDRTGPTGLGSSMRKGMGRRAGVQADPAPGGTFDGFGRPRSCKGRGLRMGYRASNEAGCIGSSTRQEPRQPFNQSSGPRSELDYLKNYASDLEKSLSAIKARIAEMLKGQETDQGSE